MRSVVIIQARTNSSRLPGKVLLPISGFPLVVLAARRAGNTGRPVIVATSNEVTDNVLSHVLAQNHIPCFRGSLNNTLQRFVNALAEYNNDTLVFRLTADNVFPDGALLNELEEHFLASNLCYLSCSGEDSGLPYGVSAELMRLSDLREADRVATSNFDREHVTPYIRRKYGDSTFSKYRTYQKSHFRATIDYIDDYVSIQQVFEGVRDPVAEPFQSLISRIEKTHFQPTVSFPAKKFVLGTAQMGMNYGILNKSGKPSQELATRLLTTSINNGVLYFDTARAYGDSESVIGRTLPNGWEDRVTIITKLSPLAECPEDASSQVIEAFVEASLFQSCRELGVKTLGVLLLHRAEHLTAWNGKVWDHLQKLKNDGVIDRLGVSIQNPRELVNCLSDPFVDYIQMPFNILDWRWSEFIPLIEAAKRKRNIIIHVRSALLQGLLTSRNPAHWAKSGLSNPKTVINWLDSQQKEQNRSSVTTLCIDYCLSQSWVDGVVIGVESEQQLAENLAICSNKNSVSLELSSIESSRPTISEDVLDPARWQRNQS